MKKESPEEIFQRYYRLRGYRSLRVNKSNEHGVRTPDFEIMADNVKIVAEVKELTANEDDLRNWKATLSGEIVVHSREPGKRARSLIEGARGQLRPYADAGIPTIAALYDNIVVDKIRVGSSKLGFSPLSMTDIDVALYGLWQANVRIHPGYRVESLGDTRSGYRRMPDRKIISAVMVIHEPAESRDPFALTYHNYWASVPLPRNVFSGQNDLHFAKATDPDLQSNRWVRI
jgi:hypothetical protein